eukprot:CAMPEP_0202869560 /NCGR_PEP_ID=MMETSP1391-20130828/12524_1 /ASSEMBLY_ACC=CAM_ASM_000867 /TAXON_ID=1034604 /ORGANISM="Chlamydomonas leiostraca, Strain SAG 11-49" /LENGTH=38 /DNA_ID= /DNA_START= /DNA_END= /DNA_ORIENTATION=
MREQNSAAPQINQPVSRVGHQVIESRGKPRLAEPGAKA